VADQTAQAVAVHHYQQQQRIVRRSANTAQDLWRRMDRSDLDGSWRALAPALLDAVIAGQENAAGQADAYVSTVIAAQGLTSDPAGRLNPKAFAGEAADGRSLVSLLYQPVIDWRVRLAAGQSMKDAATGSLSSLLRIVGTEVADAGRGATGASIAGNRTINGYIRVVNSPACARCIILAGKEYGWNAGFLRHPKCDCVHMPAKLIARNRHHPGAFDPEAYFKGLSKREQDRIFTQAGAQAIRDGASMSSVVNARRSMYTTNAYGRTLRATREGTTRRGWFFHLERQRSIRDGTLRGSGRGFRLRTPRLTPEEIYAQAEGRDEAIAMLRRYGYLT
jgi:hypothetical protein